MKVDMIFNHKVHKERNSASCETFVPLVVKTPEGKILFEGRDVTGLTVSAMIRYGVIFVIGEKRCWRIVHV